MQKKMTAKDYSQLQEKQIAKSLGGRIQSNSGGTIFGGGDVHTKTFFVEAKTVCTEKLSISIKKEWIDKLKQQAFEQCKDHWALAFRFEPHGADYFVINSYLMQQLILEMEK